MALKDVNASANDSSLDLPKFDASETWPSVLVMEVVDEVGLKRPVHDFGVDQALGAEGAGLSSSSVTSVCAAES